MPKKQVSEMGCEDNVVDITGIIKMNAEKKSASREKGEYCKFSSIDKNHVLTQREIVMIFEEVYVYAKEYVAKMKEQGVLDSDATAFIR